MSESSTSKIKQNATIFLLSAIGFFGIFSTTMSKSPVLSLFTDALGPDKTVIGLIAAISPLAGIIFSFPIGFLSDKIGKKRLLIISASVFLIAPLLYLFVFNALFLIPVRFFHGIATAILGPLASAIICDAYPENKGEKLGIYSSATLFGRTLAPIIGGIIIMIFVFMNGIWNYKMVYLFAFVIAVPVFIFSLLVKESSNDTEIKKIKIKDFFKSLKDFILEKKLLGTSLIEMSIYFTFGAFETFLQLYLKSINYPIVLISIVFSIQIISIALTKPIFGKMSDNLDRRLQIIIGMLVIAFSIIIFPFFQNPFIIIPISVIFGLGMSLATVATATYVADIAKKENLGSSLGALSSIMDIGHSSGPFIVGIIISLTAKYVIDNKILFYNFDLSYITGFLCCTVVCLLSIAAFLIFNFGREKNK